MGELADRMRQDLVLRNYSPRTVPQYLGCARRFAAFHRRSPAEMGETEVRAYLQHLLEDGRIHNSVRVTVAALKFLYRKTLDRPEVVARIPWPREPRRLPEIPSHDEPRRLLAAPCPTARALVGAMRKLFRGIVATHLRRRFDGGQLRVPDDLADPAAFQRLLRSVHRQDWVVYAKAPFAGAYHVFRYLGRYTHRMGLSDQRLIAVSDAEVTFRTRGADRLTVTVDEFLRRFLLHVLPDNFHKIRHFGLYSGTGVREALPIARSVVAKLPDATPPPPSQPTPPKVLGPRPCPRCGAPLGHLPLDFADDLGVTLRWPPPREPQDTS